MKRLLAIFVLGILGWMCGSPEVMGQPSVWSTGGNAPLSNQYPFLGTNINYPLMFRINGQHAGIVEFEGSTFVGSYAGDTNNVHPNTGFGAGVLKNSSGQHNSGFGLNALHLNTSGGENMAAGDSAMFANQTGNGGTAVGVGALSDNISGNNNSAFGHNANVASGNLTNATAIGANAVVSQSNSMVLGSNGVNVGIGTPAPVAKLDVIGQIKITDGTEGSGKILISDAAGLAHWVLPQAVNAWNITGNGNIVNGTHFLGTTNNAPLNLKVNNQWAGTINVDGTTFLGSLAGQSSAPGNTGFGYGVLQNASGIGNTGVGQSALYSNGSGYWNTATGDSALYSNTTGYGNTATGYISLSSNTTGIGNTGLGGAALNGNTTGNFNTAVGGGSLANNTSGSNNTALGIFSLLHNTTGESNTATGPYALQENTIGSANTATGSRALERNKSGFNNTAVGVEAMQFNLSGRGNTAVGRSAMLSNETGQENTAVGGSALMNNLVGIRNTALGVNALLNTTSNLVTGVGHGALQNNTTGAANTAIGAGALNRNTTVGNLVAVGDSALYNNAAIANTAVGSNALFTNTTGFENTALGHEALRMNSIGNYNTAIGSGALKANTNAISNTAVGSGAMNQNKTGSYNSVLGNGALNQNVNGANNTALGYFALDHNISGGQNTALGCHAMSGNVSGIHNTAIGWHTDVSAGNYSYSTAIGNAARITASNQVRIGDASVTSIGGFRNWTNISDGRLKKDIKEDVPGLEFINQLRPVTYHLDMDKIAATFHYEDSSRSKEDEAVSGAMLQTGFIAQDVERAAQKLGYDFSGVDRPKNANDVYGLRYAEFVVPLVKAAQELSAQNEENKQEILTQKETINHLLARLDRLEAIVNGCCNMAQDKDHLPASSTQTLNRLDQNAPNPFQQNTVISYYVAEQAPNTYIRIITIEGHEIARYPITDKGEGQITIAGNSLTGSLYLYELIVNDQLVASRKMVLTR